MSAVFLFGQIVCQEPPYLSGSQLKREHGATVKKEKAVYSHLWGLSVIKIQT